MNVAIAYHSRTGTTKKVADLIQEELIKNGHTVKLIPLIAEHEKGYLGSAFSAIREKEPTLINCDLSTKGNSLLILGTPIWAGCPAPHLLTYLNQTQGLDGKNVALFFTSGGEPEKQGSRRLKDSIQQRLEPHKAKLIGTPLGIQQKELENPSTQQHIKEFIESITKQ